MLLDTRLLIERRVALGLSRLQLAKRVAKSPTVIGGLERGDNHETLTLGLVASLASALAVQPRDLFATPTDGVPQPDDVRVEAALSMVDKALSTRELASGLDWSDARTLAALESLRERLAPSGVNLHQHAGRWYLRSRVAVLSREEQRGVEQARVAKARLSLYDAQVLATVVAGYATARWVADASNAQRVSLATLLRLAYAEPDRDGGLSVTESVRYSLGLDRRAPTPINALRGGGSSEAK